MAKVTFQWNIMKGTINEMLNTLSIIQPFQEHWIGACKWNQDNWYVSGFILVGSMVNDQRTESIVG